LLQKRKEAQGEIWEWRETRPGEEAWSVSAGKQLRVPGGNWGNALRTSKYTQISAKVRKPLRQAKEGWKGRGPKTGHQVRQKGGQFSLKNLASMGGAYGPERRACRGEEYGGEETS